MISVKRGAVKKQNKHPPILQLGHGVNTTLTVLHHFGEKQCKAIDGHFGFATT